MFSCARECTNLRNCWNAFACCWCASAAPSARLNSAPVPRTWSTRPWREGCALLCCQNPYHRGTEEHRSNHDSRISPVFLCAPCGKELCESAASCSSATEVCSFPVIWFLLDVGLHRPQGTPQNLPP